MTQQVDRRPARMSPAEMVVFGGLSFLLIAVLMSWVGKENPSNTRSAPIPATQPEIVAEPEPVEEHFNATEVIVAPSSDAERWDFGSDGKAAANWADLIDQGNSGLGGGS